MIQIHLPRSEKMLCGECGQPKWKCRCFQNIDASKWYSLHGVRLTKVSRSHVQQATRNKPVKARKK